MSNRWGTALPLAVTLAFALVAGLALATPQAATASGLQSIDEKDRIDLPYNVDPLAKPEHEVGRTDLVLPMQRMILVLPLRPGAQAQLDRRLAAQQDPASPQYHRWLTPEQFGARFGLPDADLELVTGWLQSQGFAIDGVARGRGWINFSGTVAQVEQAFATEIHDYEVAGKTYHANSIDPSIPRALASLVQGVVALHGFPFASHLSAQSIVDDNQPGPLRIGFARCDSAMGSAEFAFYKNLGAQAASQGIAAIVPSGDADVAGCTGETETTGPARAVTGPTAKAQLASPDFSLSASPSAPQIDLGVSGNVSITTTISGGFNSAITLTTFGLPAGVTASFSPASIAAPGAGTTTLTLTVGSSTALGTYSIMVIGNGGGFSRTTSVTLTAGLPQFTIAASPTSISLSPGGSGHSTTISTAVSGLFNSTINLSVSGLPSGVTAVFGPSSSPTYSIVAPGAGSVTLTFTAAATAAAGTWTITVTGVGGGLTHSATITLTVAPPSFAMSCSGTTISSGGSGFASVSVSISGGFNSAITLGVAPTFGVSGSISPSSIAAPGAGSATVFISVSSFASTGINYLTVFGSGGGLNRTCGIPVTVY